MLKIEDLRKRYVSESGQRKGGIAGVSFEVREGEMFTLLGPSGCGKTTTLRCIAGLEQPDSGRIRLGERDVYNGAARVNVPMHERDIGMVFQSYAIWPHMNVFDNAGYPLQVRRQGRGSKAEVEARVMRALEMVGLADFRGRSATKLSGGQQQRLALARALVREPKLLLLDEPLSNLDALLREQMRSEIKRLQTEWGVTTIYVTHDQGEAMALSDRIAVLNDAEIIQVGTPNEIYDWPNSEFVASFIGRTNLFHGRVSQRVPPNSVGEVRTDVGAMRCLFLHGAEAGSAITFVIRPENIELALGGGAANAGNTLQGTVRSRVFLGEISEFAIELSGGKAVIARLRPSTAIHPGDAVTIHLPEQRSVAITTQGEPPSRSVGAPAYGADVRVVPGPGGSHLAGEAASY